MKALSYYKYGAPTELNEVSAPPNFIAAAKAKALWKKRFASSFTTSWMAWTPDGVPFVRSLTHAVRSLPRIVRNVEFIREKSRAKAFPEFLATRRWLSGIQQQESSISSSPTSPTSRPSREIPSSAETPKFLDTPFPHSQAHRWP